MTDPMITDPDGKLYVTLAWFEADKGRSHDTIHAWIHRGDARSITRNGTVYVHWGDALRLHTTTATQPRRSLPRRAS